MKPNDPIFARPSSGALSQTGMDIRTFTAIQALKALLSDPRAFKHDWTPQSIADKAIEVTDALLEKLNA